MKQLLSNKWSIAILVLFSLVVSSMLIVLPAKATDPEGLHPSPVASGTIPGVVRAKFMDDKNGFGDGTYVKTISMIKFNVDPGGTFGWHQHGGPVWVVVSAGTVTIYEGDDPDCTPHIYGPGSAFLDPGDHTHLGVNETADEVEIYATFMLPEGGLPRLDAEDPGNCD